MGVCPYDSRKRADKCEAVLNPVRSAVSDTLRPDRSNSAALRSRYCRIRLAGGVESDCALCGRASCGSSPAGRPASQPQSSRRPDAGRATHKSGSGTGPLRRLLSLPVLGIYGSGQGKLLAVMLGQFLLAANQIVQPKVQFSNAKGFGQVLIRSLPEPLDAALLVGFGR